jgi:hypothetical protein
MYLWRVDVPCQSLQKKSTRRTAISNASSVSASIIVFCMVFRAVSRYSFFQLCSINCERACHQAQQDTPAKPYQSDYRAQGISCAMIPATTELMCS